MAKQISEKRMAELQELAKQTVIIERTGYKYGIVSTVIPGDTKKPETAIQDFRYNCIIVAEEYSTDKEAKAGHVKWFDKMINEAPEYLEEKSTSPDSPNDYGTKFYKAKR